MNPPWMNQKIVIAFTSRQQISRRMWKVWDTWVLFFAVWGCGVDEIKSMYHAHSIPHQLSVKGGFLFGSEGGPTKVPKTGDPVKSRRPLRKSPTNITTCAYGCLVPMGTLLLHHHHCPIESLGGKQFSILIRTFFHSCVDDAQWHTSYAQLLTPNPSGGFGRHMSTKLCYRLT